MLNFIHFRYDGLEFKALALMVFFAQKQWLVNFTY